MSPFPLPVTQLPTLGQFISNGARTDGTQNQITKDAPVVVPWPAAAFNTGDGRKGEAL